MSVFAEALMTMHSESDSNGLYSYTFASSNTAHVWGIKETYPGASGFYLQSFDVTNIVAPDGWSGIEDPDGYVRFVYTNEGVFFLENTSVTFSIGTIWTNCTTYSNREDHTKYYIRGWVLACAYSATNHINVAPGYQALNYLGPAVPHLDCIKQEDDSLLVTLCDTYGRTCYIERASSLTSQTWQAVTSVYSVVGCTNIALPFLGGDASFVRFNSE